MFFTLNLLISIYDNMTKSLSFSAIFLLFASIIFPAFAVAGQTGDVPEPFLSATEEDGKYLLHVPERTLGRDILVTITILKGSATNQRDPQSRLGYGGDSAWQTMVRLAKSGDRIEILQPEIIPPGREKSISRRYAESALPQPIHSLPITETTDGVYTVDITSLYTSDTDLFTLRGASNGLKLGGYIGGAFRNISIDAYPENLNFKSVRSYSVAPPQGGGQGQRGAPAPAPQTRRSEPALAPTATLWEVGACWSLLPEKPMTMRISDQRVGYFSTRFDGEILRSDVTQSVSAANRWRLEPRPEDRERYLRGEVVEPVKPIVFYIDRATPEFLQPYFIEAVEAWQPVFEKAGFRNAVQARLAPTPEEDPSYSEEDVRYSLISYKASPIANAYGPMIVDPRSGEALTAHIGIFHSVFDLVHRWYFSMCAAVDPAARQIPFDNDLMGKLAKTVITHEVGHSLGLMHDFAGSTAYTTDQLRDPEFVRQNGLGASIMDYQRFNYVAQPGDGHTVDELTVRTGVYDDFAIEWGYRWFPDSMPLAEQTETLRQWVTDRRTEDPRLAFITERDQRDPRIQSEDYAKDIVRANRLGMRNLIETVENIEAWTDTIQDPDGFMLSQRYSACINQYRNMLGHALRFVGGRYTDNPDRDEPGDLYRAVPRAEQLEALEFLRDFLFTEPAWIFDPALIEKVNVDMEGLVRQIAAPVVHQFVHISAELSKSDELTYEELLDTIYSYTFTGHGNTLSFYEKTMQSVVLNGMLSTARTNMANGTGIALNRCLMRIGEHAAAAVQNAGDELTAAHYRAIVSLIEIFEQGDLSDIIE